jgi:hypothetical protein
MTRHVLNLSPRSIVIARPLVMPAKTVEVLDNPAS